MDIFKAKAAGFSNEWMQGRRERETTKAELESFGKSSDSEDPNSNLSSVISYLVKVDK